MQNKSEVQQLDKLYRRYWPGLSAALEKLPVSAYKEEGPTNPLLLSLVDVERYSQSDLKIMIFGQETLGWHGKFGSIEVSELYVEYDNFFHREGFKSQGGQFWNSFRHFREIIQELYANQSVSFLWNNVIKIGKNDKAGMPGQQIIDAQIEHFPVVREEIQILKPDIVLFFTSYRYDRFLQRYFKDLYLQPVLDFKTVELAKMYSPEIPANTFRTYHPGYLYRRGRDYYAQVKQAILTEIKTKGN